MLLAARTICALRRLPVDRRRRRWLPWLPLAIACAAIASTAEAQQPAVSARLDALEMQVAALEAGGADEKRLGALAGDAQDAWQRATSASDRVRARRVLRRVERMAAGEPPLNFSTKLASHQEATAGVASNATPLTQGLATQAQWAAPSLPGPAVVTDAAAAAGMAAPSMVQLIAPPTRLYANLDALGFWVKSDPLPALVTTSPIGTPQSIAGVLGQPTTSVLFGDQSVNGGLRPGGRVQGGFWVSPMQTFALEGHYYALATETTTYTAESTFSDGTLDDQILARPFFNVAPGIDAQRAILVAFPDFIVMPLVFDIDGSIQVKESSRIQSAAGGGRYALNGPASPLRLFLLGAYRYFNLNESLSIVSSSTPGSDPFPIPLPPGRIEVVDSFSTNNTFNGGEVGLGAELSRWRMSLGAETRLAMGNMRQTLDIDGRTSAISGIYVASYEGGLLAQLTNIGGYAKNVFALIPSVDVRLGYQVLPALRLTVGYNFTYVSSVLRPGDQVDTSVNTTQIAGLPLVGPARPEATLDDTSIWLQGVTAGLDLRF